MPRRYFPRSSVCSTRPRRSRATTSRNAVLLCTPSSSGDLGDPRLPRARQHLHDRRRPGRPTGPCPPEGPHLCAWRNSRPDAVAYPTIRIGKRNSAHQDHARKATGMTPNPEFVLTLDCVDRPGIVHAVSGFLVEQGGEHRREPAVRRQPREPLLHAGALRDRRERPDADVEALRTAFEPVAERFGMTWTLWDARDAVPDAPHGVEVRSLPQRPAVPLEHRLAADRHPGDRVEPPRPRAAGAAVRHPVPPHPGDRGHQAGGRGAAARAGARARRRPRGAGALHAGAVRRGLQGARRPGDQHPPQLPAELQGREALPPGVRARREARRRDRALRDARPRRGPDHRAGRHARRPLLRPPSTSSRPAATSSARCCPAPSAGTPRPASCATATGPSSSADPPSREKCACQRALLPARRQRWTR